MGKLVQWTLAFTLLIYEMKNCFPFTALLKYVTDFHFFFTIFIGIMFTLIHNDDDGDDDDNTNNNNHNNNTSIL